MSRRPRKGNVFYAVEVAEIRKKKNKQTKKKKHGDCNGIMYYVKGMQI